MRSVDRLSGRRCYTLIELIIVIAILGIAGALLIPHLGARSAMTAQGAVRLIIGDLSFAQADALANQELRRVHFYNDGRGYCLVRLDSADLNQPFDENATDHDYVIDPLSRPGSLGLYIVDFTTDRRFGGITISNVDIDGGSRDLTFDSLGGTIQGNGLPGSGGTIHIGSSDETYEITIEPFTGKLTVRQL